jgi:hypothetical protein
MPPEQQSEVSIPERFGSLLTDVPDDKPEAPERAAPEIEPEQSGDDAAPEEASGEPEQEAEPETPAIEPPLSWKADKKELFKQLPPELQAAIAERESEREKFVSRQSKEAVEAKKAAEAERTAIQQERQNALSTLQSIIPALQEQIAGEFKDIKSISDIEKLAREDPARFVVWQAKQQALAQAHQQQQHLAELQGKEVQKAQEEYLNEQSRLLTEKLPEWTDPVKGKALRSEIREYLQETGYKDEELARLVDHRDLIIARKAMLYDKAQAARAKAAPVKQTAPTPIKSGTPQGKQTDEKRADLRKQLKRTGDGRFAARLIEDLL